MVEVVEPVESVESVESSRPLPVELAVEELSDGELAPGRIPDKRPPRRPDTLGVAMDEALSVNSPVRDTVKLAGGEGVAVESLGRLPVAELETALPVGAGELGPSPVELGLGEVGAADLDSSSSLKAELEEGSVADADLDSSPGPETELEELPVFDADLDSSASPDVELAKLLVLADGELGPPKIPSRSPGSEVVLAGFAVSVVCFELLEPKRIPSKSPASWEVVGDAVLSPALSEVALCELEVA